MMSLQFVDWGLIEYTKALEQQEVLVELVHQKKQAPTIIFCTHPPIVTKGRSTQPNDITTWNGPIYEINRGGRATYHGPSQLLIYPIVPLGEVSENSQRTPSDVGSFLRQFELALVDTLAELGIFAQGKSFQTNKRENDSLKEETGVWVGDKKIASLGLSFRHWISFHGAALNIDHDPSAFQGLFPCGFSPSIMTSVEEQLQKKCDREKIKSLLENKLMLRL